MCEADQEFLLRLVGRLKLDSKTDAETESSFSIVLSRKVDCDVG